MPSYNKETCVTRCTVYNKPLLFVLSGLCPTYKSLRLYSGDQLIYMTHRALQGAGLSWHAPVKGIIDEGNRLHRPVCSVCYRFHEMRATMNLCGIGRVNYNSR